MDIQLIHKLQPFVIALLLGLLIGVEREQSHPPGLQPMGLRSFALLSLLGALAAYINQIWIAATLTLFVGAAVIAGYVLSSKRSEENDIGITTEIAAVAAYVLGYIAHIDSIITLILGVVVLIILLARTRLHQFSRSQLRPEELKATAILLAIALGFLPFLPDKTIDPWNLFNPLRFASTVLIIALLQFCAYAGIRILGPKKGILVSGFLAGFVSSTAATATLSHQARKDKAAATLVIALAVVLTTIAMLIKLLIIIFIVSPALFYSAGLPSMVVIILFSSLVLFLVRYIKKTDHYPAPKNPLELVSAIRLALFLALMLALVTLAQRFLGQVGSQAVIFLGGLAEIQGVTLAISTLYHEDELTLLQAINGVGLAVVASFISKFIISLSIMRGYFALTTMAFLTLMLLVYLGVWIAVPIVLAF